MKNIIFIALSCISFITFLSPSSSFASHIDLKPCVEISHCVKEKINVENIDKPFEEIQSIVEKTPRTKIVEIDGDYLHAEVTSRIMKYIDDLEISYDVDKNNLEIRSESRVGEGDFGVNAKRVENLKNKFFQSKGNL